MPPINRHNTHITYYITLQSLGFVKKSTCFEWAEPAATAAATKDGDDSADGDNDKKGQAGKDESGDDDKGETTAVEVTSLGREDRLALLEKSIELLKARQAGR
jgi:hypothetical protein